MNLYTNGFAFATKEDLSEIVINFTQVNPIVGADGEITTTKVESVASLVMNLDTAQELAKVLSKSVFRSQDNSSQE